MAWERIEPLLPGVDRQGVRGGGHGQVIIGVLWRLRTGAPWRDLPERYGPWQTVYERFARWEADGTWARLLEQVQGWRPTAWLSGGCRSLDHQPRPPACRRRPQKGAEAGDELEDPSRAAAGQALGRSRGGLTVKVHLDRDGQGLPLALVVTGGNVNDSTVFDTVLDAVRVPRAGAGRPRRTPREAAKIGGEAEPDGTPEFPVSARVLGPSATWVRWTSWEVTNGKRPWRWPRRPAT